MKISNKFWLYFASLFTVLMLVPNVVFASGEVIGQVIGWLLLYVLFQPFILLLKVEMLILPIVANFQHFTDAPGVELGWKVVRDLSNMFFIVILLLMSFATILKIQAYGYKQLLRNLLIMAILINFSKLIVGVILDFFQLIMLTFVDAWSSATAGNLSAALGLNELVSFAQNNNGSGIGGEANVVMQIVLGYLLASIMVVVAVIIVMAFIVTLVMRIVFIWVLIVLAPFAFVCRAFPFTQKYFQDWMAALSAEIVIGPAMAFFLWLSFSIVGGGNIDQQFNTVESTAQFQSYGTSTLIQLDEKGTAGPTEAGKPSNMLKYIVGIAMLLASLKVSQKIGSAAGNMGKDFGKKFGGGTALWYSNKLRKGFSGEGGAEGALRRVTTPVASGGLRMAGKIPLLGTPLARAGLSLNQIERNRQIRKQAKMEDATKGMTSTEKREYLGVGLTGYSKRAIDKLDIEENKVKDRDPEQIKAMVKRAKAINDTETVAKLQNTEAMANDAESIQEALDSDKGKERYVKLNMRGTFDKDENGNVIASAAGSNAYQQGQMLAKGFLQLAAKDQDEVLKGMDKDSKEAMLEYVKLLPKDVLQGMDEKDDKKMFVNKKKEIQEPILNKDGTQQEVNGVKQFRTVVKNEQEINEDSARWKKFSLLAKYKSGEANTATVYDNIIADTEGQVKREKGAEANFKKESIDKTLVKAMTGADLAKMNPSTKMFKNMAEHFSFAQMRAMSDEGAAANLQIAVDVKLESANRKITEGTAQGGVVGQSKVRDGQAEIARLKNNMVTRAYVGGVNRSTGNNVDNNDDDDEPTVVTV